MIIHNKEIEEKLVEKLIKKIREKKELQGLSDDYIEEDLEKYLLQNSKAVKSVVENKTRSEEYKKIVKAVRAKLRIVHGMFAEDLKKRDELLVELENTQSFEKILEINDKILLTHKSTKERVALYPKLYAKLFSITKIPRVILDLGCGLNPVSFPYMKLVNVEYIASDLSKTDCEFLSKYFKIMKIKGEVFDFDLRKIDKNKKKLNKLKKADVCFLFKVLDTIEKKGHKIAEKVIEKIPSKWIVASFATQKLGGKPMRKPKRKWLELMLDRLGFGYEFIEEENEVFYIIDKRIENMD